MGEHDYAVLAVVAVVAIAAVASMAWYSPSELVEETRNFIPATGMASSSFTQTPQGNPPDFDFTGDGRFTVEDSYLLAQYIYERRCPPQKMCDVNGDGVIDMRDLELFNTMIESPATTPRPEQNRAARPVRTTRSPPSSVGSRLA